jgi:hypothetical protein
MSGAGADILMLKPGELYGDPVEITEYDELTHEERVYRCVLCGEKITAEKNRVPVKGQHEHTFTNPHGFIFTIGCFSDAPGCRCAGYPTSEFTWFAGYAWRYAACGGCGTHMGWEFSSDADLFFGLILNRLSEASSG